MGKMIDLQIAMGDYILLEAQTCPRLASN